MTDRAQFTSDAWLDVLKGADVRISMDGKGRWVDNVFVERLWRSVKYENVYLHAYRDGREARAQVAEIWRPFFDWVKARPQDFTVTDGMWAEARDARSQWDPSNHGFKHDPRDGAPKHHVYNRGNEGECGAFLYGYDSLWLPASLLDDSRQKGLTAALFAASRHEMVRLHINKGMAGARPEVLAEVSQTATNRDPHSHATDRNQGSHTRITGGCPWARVVSGRVFRFLGRRPFAPRGHRDISADEASVGGPMVAHLLNSPFPVHRGQLNEETTTLTTQRNAVSFAVYLDDGRLLLQVRGFFSPDGQPVSNAGMLSINGGGMESDDPVAELLREIHEELGIEFDRSDIGSRIRYLGDVLDVTAGRICHVHRLLEGYRRLLTDLPPGEAVRILLDPEGLGRVAVWREDLDILVAQGRLTPISVAILDALPDLAPPAQPVRAVS